MSWKGRLGWALARVVQTVGAASAAPRRHLDERERRILEAIFGPALDTGAIEVREALEGLINVSRRAFVIENTMYLPLPVRAVPTHLLVHEATHVWQFQNGGHAYITDSLAAQSFGDGYQLEKGLLQGRSWAELNCEQQATLVEHAWEQGCFEGRPLVIRGGDWTHAFDAARTEWRAGRGAAFTSAGTRGR
ncbi:MAG: hypothetical protein JNJ54_23460 [Myxococcaceae bacterium]|nr:hypothetical protein [Myxococcaceae bacterium]